MSGPNHLGRCPAADCGAELLVAGDRILPTDYVEVVGQFEVSDRSAPQITRRKYKELGSWQRPKSGSCRRCLPLGAFARDIGHLDWHHRTLWPILDVNGALVGCSGLIVAGAARAVKHSSRLSDFKLTHYLRRGALRVRPLVGVPRRRGRADHGRERPRARGYRLRRVREGVRWAWTSASASRWAT